MFFAQTQVFHNGKQIMSEGDSCMFVCDFHAADASLVLTRYGLKRCWRSYFNKYGVLLNINVIYNGKY